MTAAAKDRHTVRVPLAGGPQDGAEVVMYTDDVKPLIWVGPAWLGDGASAYTTDGPSRRFPVGHRYERGRYQHTMG